MEAEELLFKIDNIERGKTIHKIWIRLRNENAINLINQFEKETLINAIKHCKQYPQLMLNNPPEIILRHM